jgi:hypothetical protein
MTVQTVKAKFWVKDVTHHHNGQPDGDQVCATVKLAPCFGSYPGGDSEENKSFSKWTPQGEVTMMITNPEAIEFFELGKPYYIDFRPAE